MSNWLEFLFNWLKFAHSWLITARDPQDKCWLLQLQDFPAFTILFTINEKAGDNARLLSVLLK
jgi:hypothetical protein